jgi:hypothetical protein
MSLERFGRNDPLDPSDFVVDDQFASLAQGTGRIFGDIQSSVIGVLLSIQESITFQLDSGLNGCNQFIQRDNGTQDDHL